MAKETNKPTPTGINDSVNPTTASSGKPPRK